jgi:hypothetical protein
MLHLYYIDALKVQFFSNIVEQTMFNCFQICHLPEISLISPVNIAIVNALWTIVTGENYDLDDPRILKIVQTIDKAVRSTNRLNIWAYYFPGLARHFWKGFKQCVRQASQIRYPWCYF